MSEATTTPPQSLRLCATDDATDKSRQKSCHACVRSKRRCDKRTPRCTRCAEKGFSCLYVNLPPAASARQRAAAQLSDAAMPPGLDSSPMETETELDAMGMQSDHDYDLDPMPDCAPGPQANMDTLLDDVNMLSDAPLSFDLPSFDFNNLMNYMTVDQEGGRMQLWHTQDAPKATTVRLATPPPLDRTPYHSVSIEGGKPQSCSNLSPWTIHEPGSRVGFVISSFKDFPILLARERETPFVHRHLYRAQTPRAMLTAYSVATAYANRTDANKAWAFRLLCEAADELVGRPGRSQPKDEGAPQVPQLEMTVPAQFLTPMDKLARTQALLIYQQIRMFDGDISLRAQAEHDMGVLEDWLGDLERYRDNLAEQWLLEESTLRERPPRSWERWIFAECVRRTIMLGAAFMAIVSMLKTIGTGEPPDPSQFAAVHRWTSSKFLWEADSPLTFMTAWRERRQYIVQNFFVEELPKTMKAAELDSMTRLLLTSFIGVDEMEQWISTGGVFTENIDRTRM
ncbi:hypothetical protein BN1708_000700 [Verticillium longisporum]|uniref:Zn(2)-C6 fungal-type domain-containing protein n=1 Tax=Verticillium longisporum TaxID=100787 RepID=A0A0G4LY43_VERLO|nr:hypothetical protein BN1708_000700 [Verticillium longisporum]